MKLIKLDEKFSDYMKLINLEEQMRISPKNTSNEDFPKKYIKWGFPKKYTKKKTYSWRGGRGPYARGAPETRRGAAARFARSRAAADWESARGSGGPAPWVGARGSFMLI